VYSLYYSQVPQAYRQLCLFPGNGVDLMPKNRLLRSKDLEIWVVHESNRLSAAQRISFDRFCQSVMLCISITYGNHVDLCTGGLARAEHISNHLVEGDILPVQRVNTTCSSGGYKPQATDVREQSWHEYCAALLNPALRRIGDDGDSAELLCSTKC